MHGSTTEIISLSHKPPGEHAIRNAYSVATTEAEKAGGHLQLL
jgi:hypothetical protein